MTNNLKTVTSEENNQEQATEVQHSFYIFHNEHRPNYDDFCFYKNAFNDEEMDKIVEIGNQQDSMMSQVGGNDHSGITDKKVRKSNNSWIGFVPDETTWIFDKLGSIVLDANKHRYNFSLKGFMEPLQFTQYNEFGSHYDMHQDHGPGIMAQRKLSCVLMLSDEKDYEGGELEFFNQPPRRFPKGTVVVFPSFQVHGVRPVVSGKRISLVGWISGDPFR